MSNLLQNKETGFLRVKFQTLEQGDGTFEGYGAVYGNVDLGGDIIEPGAFTKSLGQHRSAGTSPVMLWMHKQDQPIGRWLAFDENEIGLLVRGQLNLGTTKGRDAHAHIVSGDVTGLSIGYTIPAGGASIDKSQPGVTRIKTATLHEISVVTLPMNERARIRIESKGDLEDLLRKNGLAKEAARAVAFGGWPALSRQPDTTTNLTRLLQAVTKSAREL